MKEFTEKELWVIATALFEYQKDPISQEHGDVAKKLYEEIKEYILSKIKNH